MILRKGSVSARKGEKLLIPINMKDGSLVCVGKGNEEWNFSAPHGAGRIMSRGEAFRTLSVEEFRKQMEGIYTTTANSRTLDESPMAYKDMRDIVDNITPTAEIIKIIKPVYNFKADQQAGLPLALSQWKIFLMNKMLTADRSGKCIWICEERMTIEQRDKISMRPFEGSPYRVPA